MSNKVRQTIGRRQATVTLPDYVMADVRNEAKKLNRSISSVIAMYVLKGLYERPNKETIAAIEECRSGVELDDFDPNSLDEYIKQYETETIDTV